MRYAHAFAHCKGSLSAWIVLLACALCAAQGCDSTEDTGNADATGDGTGQGEPIVLSGVLQGDRTFASGERYILNDIVYIALGTLTIEPGVTVYGRPGSALVITRSGRINAVGTADAPIVFTSAAGLDSAGTARKAGDWGGVSMLGSARVNTDAGASTVDGLDADERYGSYGGTEEDHNCGTLQYARVEFAGAKISEFLGFNGLTVAGCGSATTLDHIQVHAAAEDGIEFLGGNANLAYSLVTGTLEDSIDFSLGWEGKVQFLVIQQPAELGGEGIEGDNNEDKHDATPRSNPVIYNATLIGSHSAGGEQRGLLLRRGATGTLANSVVMGFPNEAFDFRDTSTTDQVAAGTLSIKSTLFYDVGPDGKTATNNDADEDGDDDAGYEEGVYIQAPTRSNVFEQDPKLPSPYATPPQLIPPADSPAATAGAPLPTADAFFKADGSTYLGAFKPGGTDWTAGWTAYPTE